MTIAGQLEVTASDDPRFPSGSSIGIVIDPGLTLTVSQSVEVSAPPSPSAPAAVEPAPTSGVEVVAVDTADPNPDSTPPATP